MIAVISRNNQTKDLLDFLERIKFAKCFPEGSSIKGCRIASGEADVYFKFDEIYEWDICAMDIIVREAGGNMTLLNGNEIKYNQKDTYITSGFLVSNSKIHNELLKLCPRHRQTD